MIFQNLLRLLWWWRWLYFPYATALTFVHWKCATQSCECTFTPIIWLLIMVDVSILMAILNPISSFFFCILFTWNDDTPQVKSNWYEMRIYLTLFSFFSPIIAHGRPCNCLPFIPSLFFCLLFSFSLLYLYCTSSQSHNYTYIVICIISFDKFCMFFDRLPLHSLSSSSSSFLWLSV